jgi:hypothetical protein
MNFLPRENSFAGIGMDGCPKYLVSIQAFNTTLAGMSSWYCIIGIFHKQEIKD